VTILSSLIPLLIGFTLGLIGGGGSVLAVPALVYLFGLDAKSSIAVSLLVVGISALISVLVHQSRKKIPIKKIIPFSISGMLGSFLAAKFIAPYLSNSLQLIYFAVMIVVVSIYMFTKKSKEDMNEIDLGVNYTLAIIIGFILGLITGLIGVGGGFLIVPVLVYFMKLQLHTAIASSLIVIAMQAITGFIVYSKYINVEYNFIVTFSIIFFIGSFIGARFSSKVPVQILNKIFAIILFLIGIFVVVKEIT
jgi:uncharacterized protein